MTDRNPDDSTLRRDIESIIRTVVASRDPAQRVSSALDLQGDQLLVGTDKFQIELTGRIDIVAIGKASIPMAAGALAALGDRVSSATAVTKSGLGWLISPPPMLDVIEADHPVPGESSLRAGERVLEIARGANEGDLVIMLVSGGASALVESLIDGVSIDDLQAMTNAMLRRGATIEDLNAVRRHVSRIKGGRLAGEIAPARIVNLIISDVLGNSLPVIASGPTVPPVKTTRPVDRIIDRFNLSSTLPDTVLDVVRERASERNDWPGNVICSEVIDDARRAAFDAVQAARELGYQTQTLGFDFQGEARELGRNWSVIARHASQVPDAFPLPLALIGSGETTVTVTGDGSGGRNTEMALAAAMELDGCSGVSICSFGTDGDDGVSGVAGGIVDGTTAEAARDAGVDLRSSLRNNDSATALAAANATIDVGPTGTNVNDLYLALIQPPG